MALGNAQSALHEMVAGIGMLTGITAMGLGRLCVSAAKLELANREQWKLLTTIAKNHSPRMVSHISEQL